MSDGLKSILSLIAILMYAIGVILFFVSLFGNFSSGVTTAFCGLMVGATILNGIVKSFSKDDDSNDNN